MTWSDSLNEQQQAAIVSGQQNGCVIAGPGTGKTRTLLRKALHLIEEEEVPPDRLRIVNFTNAGVNDLIHAAKSNEEYRRIDPATITTFHSLALRSLKRAQSNSVPDPLVILDNWEERNFIDEFAKPRLNIRDIREVRKIRRDYNARWCIANEEVDSWLSEGKRRKFEEVHSAAKEVLGFTTRGELTFLWWRHLRSLAQLNKFSVGVDADYILTDEYQDLNECEHKILEFLAAAGLGIFAVGDPNQSIYETLRHAHPQLCWTFEDRMAPSATTALERSYRCSRAVLKFGSALMGTAKGIPDPQEATRSGDAKILSFTSDTGEISGVVRLAQSLLKSDPNAKILIAVPFRMMASKFSDALQKSGVEHENRALQDKELSTECRLRNALRDLLADNRNSVAAATAIILRCSPTMRQQRTRELLELSYKRGERVATLLSSELVPSGPLGAAFTTVRSNLSRLSAANNLDKELSDMTECTDSTNESADSDSRTTVALQQGKVTIMTLHSCKGLEADVAIIPAVEPGGHERNLIGAAKEERRRLLYVGITRASDKVYLTFAARRYGPERYGDPTGVNSRKQASAFIDDICDRLRIKPESGSDYLKRLLRA